MKILFAASEMVPFSKTGGLADVAGALTKALSRQGHEVSAVVPLYSATKRKGFSAEEIDCMLSAPISNREEYGEVFRAVTEDGVTVYFIGKAAYYDREESRSISSARPHITTGKSFTEHPKAPIPTTRRGLSSSQKP